MTDYRYKGKILSFWQLINLYTVEIPIIQRDYAQGREDKKEIRLNFLNALYKSIDDEKSIQLDFIYGSNVENIFQPLDGQQRLTTLFLLHWYAAIKANNKDEIDIQILNKFSYETRITSRDFCKALVNNIPSLKDIEKEELSHIIIDSSWFYLSWKKDPTIDSMLRTIDDINKKFHDTDNLWEKLVSNDKLICFYFVELEHIGLTDDLYIKMNARGKLLSPFENFKAIFQKYMNDQKWEQDKKATETFAFKIDTEWTDYFWNSFKKDNSIDDALIRFISTVAMIRQSIDKTDDRISIITKLQDNPNTVRPENFSRSGFNYLIDCFEIYKKIITEKNKLDLNFPMWRHNPKTSIISEIVFEDNIFSQINSASYTQKVLFYAQTEYLLKANEFNFDQFQNWMRVIRNIVSRGNIEKSGKRPDIIRSPQTFDGVINLISELSKGCENIYDYLSSKGKRTSSFAKDQVDEEIIKAKLITNDINNKQVIFETEDNDLLMGRIDFVLHCIDFDYDKIETFDLEKFKKIQKAISK
ncbi:MAG: DUF262 domain-containing protein, partial [Proteobacteria bacterium]|nr:DUF262 domain-containing protein [Pseudomonadota bacterium]